MFGVGEGIQLIAMFPLILLEVDIYGLYFQNQQMHRLPFLLILTLLIFLQLFNIDMEFCQKLRIIFYF